MSHKTGVVCDRPDRFRCPHSASTQPSPRFLYQGTGEEENGTVTKTVHLTSNAMEGSVSLDPVRIGIPADQQWGWVSVCERKICYIHGEHEWLLLFADRWMRPSDFNIGKAETKLEAKLQKYQREPWSRNPASQADCGTTLWSHLDTPTQRGKSGDEIIYLCRWKSCWTPGTDIGDVDWMKDCFRKQAQQSGRRRSTRIEDTAARTLAKNEADDGRHQFGGISLRLFVRRW